MKLLRYPDLVERGIVKSRMTLKRLIDNHNFPAGQLITPNSRCWVEEEIDAWIASRPSAKKDLAVCKPSPRKSAAVRVA